MTILMNWPYNVVLLIGLSVLHLANCLEDERKENWDKQ